MTFDYDVVIIGAGAAGLMCVMEAGKRGRRVLVLEHAKKIIRKNPYFEWWAPQLHQPICK